MVRVSMGMGVFLMGFHTRSLTLLALAAAGLGGCQRGEAEIVTALRTGRRPDGRVLAPIMPWNNYRILDDADATAIAAYLKSLPPSDHRVPGPSRVENAPQPYLTVHPPASGG